VRNRVALVWIVCGVAAALSAPASAAVGPCGTSGSLSTSGGTASCTYTATAEDTFTVPTGVTDVQVDAIGAPGAPSFEGAPPPGGRGAEVTGELTGLSSAETLFVEVGGTPTGSGCAEGVHCDGGVNGGGSSDFGGGGGGASDVRTTPPQTPARLTPGC
jgi:hypothetical protein